jgi:hypothetical protein
MPSTALIRDLSQAAGVWGGLRKASLFCNSSARATVRASRADFRISTSLSIMESIRMLLDAGGSSWVNRASCSSTRMRVTAV